MAMSPLRLLLIAPTTLKNNSARHAHRLQPGRTNFYGSPWRVAGVLTFHPTDTRVLHSRPPWRIFVGRLRRLELTRLTSSAHGCTLWAMLKTRFQLAPVLFLVVALFAGCHCSLAADGNQQFADLGACKLVNGRQI